MPAPAPRFVLTVNSGSSSVKFVLFSSRVGQRDPGRELAGAVTGIGGGRAGMSIEGTDPPADLGPGMTHAGAAAHILAWLKPQLAGRDLAAVAHRIVHGGERFDRPTRLTAAAIDDLRQLTSLAPNHLPDALTLIDAFAGALSQTPQIACFDTAFHRSLPAVSRTIPVPALPGLRRYGFHGLSFTYLMQALAARAGDDAARGRIVLAHLGNGASLAAVHDGQCRDTSMGLTPTGGLVMSTRAGDLDPGVVTYLARERRLDAAALDELLMRQSGLAAISGGESDMRALVDAEAHDPRARLAVDVFCYQLRKWIGAFTAALGGLDTLVFSGGIGEHAPAIRARTCAPLGCLGIDLDAALNDRNAAVISTPTSRVAVHVIPTDESAIMVRDALAVLDDSPD